MNIVVQVRNAEDLNARLMGVNMGKEQDLTKNESHFNFQKFSILEDKIFQALRSKLKKPVFFLVVINA